MYGFRKYFLRNLPDKQSQQKKTNDIDTYAEPDESSGQKNQHDFIISIQGNRQYVYHRYANRLYLDQIRHNTGEAVVLGKVDGFVLPPQSIDHNLYQSIN